MSGVRLLINAVEADRGDAVVGRRVENHRERPELEDGHPRVAEAWHDFAFGLEPFDCARKVPHPAMPMRDRHKRPLGQAHIN
jgi:hypothetical protein